MIRVSESALVAAPPARVCGLTADDVHGRPTIQPPRYKVYREELELIGRRA